MPKVQVAIPGSSVNLVPIPKWLIFEVNSKVYYLQYFKFLDLYFFGQNLQYISMSSLLFKKNQL